MEHGTTDGTAGERPSRRRTATGFSREDVARAMAHVRHLHEASDAPAADEGLRERKKRRTRQRISDTATWMFFERGFDAVRVSEVAAEVGVAEKTVFNYFPTKESLVFDRADELVAGVRAATAARRPDESPTAAIVAMIEREVEHVTSLGAEFIPLFVAFTRLVHETPSLQAARLAMIGRLVAAAQEGLAASTGLDPEDPAPRAAAYALVALWDVQMTARERYVAAGVPAERLGPAVLADVHRAARLLDRGLATFPQAGRPTDGAGSPP